MTTQKIIAMIKKLKQTQTTMQESCIMKKQILAIAIAAGLAATPLMANAAETKVYARAHVSLDHD